MTDVFISYSRKDSEFMRYLHGELQKQERDVWVDWEDIPATADWWDEIKAAIEAADAFAFIISPDSVRSDICHDEIQHAIDNNKRFIPLLYRDISDIDAPYVHSAIRSHNWIPFSDVSHHETGIRKLLDSLSTEPEYVRRHTRLLVRAKEWHHKKREKSYLLVGDELDEFLDWIEASQTRTPKPTEIQLEYVYASQTRRSRRNMRIAAGTLSGIIVFILLVAAYIIQRQQFEAQNVLLTQEQQAQEGTQAAQDAVLTQAQVIFNNNQTQVRENNSAILTQGALEVENSDLKSTIVAFVSTVTQSSINRSTQFAEITEEMLATEVGMTEIALVSTESATQTIAVVAPTQVAATATSDSNAQQVASPVPPLPTRPGDGEEVPPSEEVYEGILFVGREGNDNNDCRSPQAGGCRTINGALEKADAGETIDIAPGVYNESLVISKDIVIVGSDEQSAVISGDFEQTVILIEAEVEVELYNLKITGGSGEVYGGGILNQGYLYMEDVIVQANSAGLVGGGIANFGELEGRDVQVVQNSAPMHQDIYSYPYAWADIDDFDYEEDDRHPLDLPETESDEYLQGNMLVYVDTTDNDRLNLRERPGLDERIVAKIENGSLAIITRDESEEHDDFTWWEIRLVTGESGWAADFVDDVETIVPFDEYVNVNGD